MSNNELIANLLQYENNVRKLFKKPPLSLDNPQELLEYCESMMEPEMLFCDGERTRTQAKRELTKLKKIHMLATKKLTMGVN